MGRTVKEINFDKPAGRISKKFGSVADFAKAIERPYNTVYGWVRGGLIPAREQAHVLTVAGEKGVDIDASYFIG